MRLRLLLVFGLLTAASLSAQTFRGGIQGTVTDKTGASVPGAQIVAVNSDNGLQRLTQTDAVGNFSLAELPLGLYDITVTHTGFSSQTAKGVRVLVSSFSRIDFTLTPGEVKESILVTGEVPLVDTSNDTVGGTIEGRQAQELPINGGDFTKLLVLVPGATGDPAGSTDSPGSFGLFSINGNRGRSNNYLLDGTDMNDGYRNLPAINEAGVFGTPATLLPIDALAEVPVLSGAQAEYGRNSGAIVNLVTKSGTNDIHGSAYEYFRNGALDARNFFNTAPSPKNAFHNNQFGGSLGGPIIKDRTFWFVAYEGWRESVGLPFLNNIPTQAQINSAISSIGGVANANPIALNILALNPWTNGAPLPLNAPATCNTPPCPAAVQQTVHASNRVDSVILKLDQHLGGHERHDLLTGRYFFGDSDQSFPLALLAGGSVPGYNTVTPTRVQVLSLSYTHVVSPKLLWELRGGWNRFAEQFLPEDQNFDPASVGLNTTSNPQDFGLPLIKIGGCPTFPPPADCNTGSFAPVGANAGNPRGRVDTNSQVFTNMSYTVGEHNLKWGAEFRRTFVTGFFDSGFRGVLNFLDLPSFLQGNRAPFGSHTATGFSRRHTFQNNFGAYFQDSFRVTPRLTFNYGVRWDYYGVLGEEDNLLSVFDPNGNGGQGSIIRVGPGGLDRLYPRDWNNFAPRLSFAYDLSGSGKTVLRAGYGLFYDAFSQDFFVGQLPFNTFNPGPAYNPLPVFGPAQIQQSFGFNITPVPCGSQPNTIPIPHSSLCAPPAFGSPTPDVFSVDQRLRTPYVQVYNANIQRQLGPNAALQVAYVGSVGHKLFRYRDINQQDPATGDFPFSNFNYVNQFESTANSSYNSLQISLNFRAFHGLTSSANYTWGHSIDNASDGQDYVINASQPDDSRNPQRERANSNFDSRHRLTWNFTYDLPLGESKLMKGWALNGVLTVASGMPYTVNVVNNFNNNFNGTNEFFGRPDLVGNPFAGTSTPFAVLNLTAFAVPCNYDISIGDCNATNPNHHIGNLARNSFVGPGYRNLDFSVVKATPLTERLTMELRADFFNIFNHPNFSNPVLPNFSVDMATNGIDASGRGKGFLPITVTPDVGIGYPYVGGGGPRNIQLAARFTF
jgi:hypothetical protein